MPEVEIDIDDLLEVNSDDERASKLQVYPCGCVCGCLYTYISIFNKPRCNILHMDQRIGTYFHSVHTSVSNFHQLQTTSLYVLFLSAVGYTLRVFRHITVCYS